MTSSTVGRPKSAGRRDLPDNLIPRARQRGGKLITYWYWRDPRDGKERSLQCPDDRAVAVKRAKDLNAMCAREQADTVVDRIARRPGLRDRGVPFDQFAVACLKRWEESQRYKSNTLRSYRSMFNAAISVFADRPLPEIEVADVARLLRGYADAGKERTAQSMRAALKAVWVEAFEEGLLPPGHPNVPALTRKTKAKVRRARLALDTFRAILEAAEALGGERGVWVPNMLLLSLLSAQRREDLAIAQFRRGRDWAKAWEAFQLGEKHPVHPYPHVDDGLLWVIQQKRGAMVQIPLSLRLEAFDMSLGDAIDRCRGAVASRYLLHHTRPFGNAPRGAPVHRDSMSRAFATARDRSGLQWPGKTPPSLHEVRSLAQRLYQEQGVDTQALLGHRHARMTEVYNDPRQAEWVKVKG